MASYLFKYRLLHWAVKQPSSGYVSRAWLYCIILFTKQSAAMDTRCVSTSQRARKSHWVAGKFRTNDVGKCVATLVAAASSLSMPLEIHEEQVTMPATLMGARR